MESRTHIDVAVAMIKNLCEELPHIVEAAEMSGDSDAGFQLLGRWKERAVRRIGEGVNSGEGQRLQRTRRSSFRMNDPLGNLREEAQLYNSFLAALMIEIEHHPDDVFERPARPPSEAPLESASRAASKRKVFIVHGRDEEMKQAAARVVEQLELEPVILHEQPNQGRTVIEKFSELADADFCVVLLSPDDMAYPSGESPDIARSRARQNVVLELGYFLGRLGRGRVAAVHRPASGFEMPSDYAGVLYIPFDANGRWQFELARELRAAGYSVDANRIR